VDLSPRWKGALFEKNASSCKIFEWKESWRTGL
jgi:hypothetical protein